MKRKTKIKLSIGLGFLIICLGCYLMFVLPVLLQAFKAIPDGEIIILTSSESNAFLVLKNQTMNPEKMDYDLYLPDDSGLFNFKTPSIIKKNVTNIHHSAFYIEWSGAMQGRGYLYPKGYPPPGKTHTFNLKIFRTKSNNFLKVNKDLSNIKYEQIK